jgi:hypothetical protein
MRLHEDATGSARRKALERNFVAGRLADSPSKWKACLIGLCLGAREPDRVWPDRAGQKQKEPTLSGRLFSNPAACFRPQPSHRRRERQDKTNMPQEFGNARKGVGFFHFLVGMSAS